MNEDNLKFEGPITEQEMLEIDIKLRASKTIELRVLRKIVSGGV